jgi:hypothetical protein
LQPVRVVLEGVVLEAQLFVPLLLVQLGLQVALERRVQAEAEEAQLLLVIPLAAVRAVQAR